jgi:hypothetical protein
MIFKATTSVYLPPIRDIVMRISICIGLLLALSLSVNAQGNLNKFKPAVKSAAKRMNDALVKKDIKTFVKTTYPKVVEMTEGGLVKIQSELEIQLNAIEKSGSKILSAWPGDATTIIDTAGEYQCTIPQYMKMQLVNGALTTQTTLIGLSQDKGKTWYFIDATDKPLNQWRNLFPNLSSKLVFFPAKEPKFEPKNGL